MRLHRSVAFLVLAAVASVAVARESGYALVGATLVNPGSAPLPASTVLIRDGRIVAAGRSGEVAVPAGTERIDARGKWLVPGYVDAHVHFFQSGGLYTRPDGLDLREVVPYEQEVANVKADLDDTFRRTLRSGITTVVDFGGPMWNFEVRRLALASPHAPRVAVAGPLISTWKPPVLADVADPPILVAESPERARELVRKQAPSKPDFVKLWFVVQDRAIDAYLPVVAAAIDEAHALGFRVAVHATELETARAAVSAGADVLVHGVSDAPVDAAFADALKRRRIVYVPTLAVRQGYERIYYRRPALAREERAWGSPDAISTFDDLGKLSPDVLPGWLVQAWKQNPGPEAPVVAGRNLKRLRDGGVSIATGTDAGNVGTLHGASYFRELKLMSDAGLTPAEILADSTLGGARLLGREKDLGSIAEGKLADLVLLDADPLAAVENFARIHAVVKQGVLMPAETIVGDGPEAPTRRNPEAFRMPGPGDQPEAVVQRQLDAYNARDVDAFVATYAAGIEVHELGGERLMHGLDALRTRYAELFRLHPAVHCEVSKRIVQGKYVIDHERISGLADGSSMDAVAVYEVRGGKIRRVWFVDG